MELYCHRGWMLTLHLIQADEDDNKFVDCAFTAGAFMHIIPRIADTYIILGTHKSHMNDELDKFISKFSCANKDSIGILLTDMFSQRIENFGMSISLYKSLKQEKINMFFEFQRQSMFEYNMLLEPGFNLFEGEYWDALFN